MPNQRSRSGDGARAGGADADGVRRLTVAPARRAGRRALVAAAALAAALAGVLLLLQLARRDAPVAPVAPPGSPPTAAGGGPAARPPLPAAARPPALAPVTAPVELDPERKVYVNQIDPHGDRTGIFAFNPPGTKPIKGGLIVPDGYVLPPGYLRHYQTTDDGEPVPPILVFHPDYQPLDADGKPIPIPADRVVPPELAPPDMPLQALEPPPVRRDWDETQTKVR